MTATTSHLTPSDGGEPSGVGSSRLQGLLSRGGRRSPFTGVAVQTPAMLPAGPATDVSAGTSSAGASRQLARATPRVSVVVPTYNEAKNLPHVLTRLPADLHEVIVVDGRSVDDTIEVARSLRPDVKIVLQNRMGKGNAMACGFAAVTGDIVVMLDADGSADPDEIPRFVAALLEGADFAKGTRFAGGGGSSDITKVRAWGNRWLNRAANVLFGTRYTDLCYGYNAFWRHCLDFLQLEPRTEELGGKRWGDGFEVETIINTRIAKAGLKIAEVPSYELLRIHGESNLNTWRDGFRVLWALVVERASRAGRTAHRQPLPPPLVLVPSVDRAGARSA
jgi:glycosyltransferase involved in cell wall biosynthesis